MATLRRRLEIAEMFSTFVHFKNDTDTEWNTNKKLRQSIETCLKESSSKSEQFWSLYWYRIWLNNTDALAFKHLFAYLQEPCYWAAIKTMTKLSRIEYELSDLFQMGIAEVEKICNGFNPERSLSIKTYANVAFPSLLKDILRQRRDADICTNYSLLRKVTGIKFVEALENAGLVSEEIARYELAWKCFKLVYNPNRIGTQRLPEPDQELWLKITNLYNQERQNLASVSKELDTKTVEKWLEKSAVWIRSYLYPAFSSLSTHYRENDLPEEWNLSQVTSESPMTVLIEMEMAEERQQQRQDIHDFLLLSLERLDAEKQEILHMYYRQNLTQKEIALKLNRPQVWVSRKLSRSRETLLEELTKWEQQSQEQQKVNVLLNPNLLKDRSVALEEWLIAHS